MSTLICVKRYAGTFELLQMFGVGRTRLAKLTARPDFPPPAVDLRMGKIWDIDRVIDWAVGGNRTLDLSGLPATGLGVDEPRVPTSPLGAAELLALLGVSQTRLMELIRERPDFPRPALAVKRGKVWDRDDIVTWAHQTGRTLTTESSV